MPLAERGLIFEERTPPARNHPNRTDIACFVGEVALRDGSAPDGRPRFAGSWEEFDRRFAWDERPVEFSDERATCLLGAAVQSFFREGGRQCYVVSTGNPPPLALGAPAQAEQRLRRIIPGYPAGIDASPVNRATWTGVAAILGLDDVSFLAMPDLPELVSAPPPLPEPLPVVVPQDEVFVPCSEELPEPEPNHVRELRAPRAAFDGYRAWARALSLVVGMLARRRREVQLLAAIPMPARGQRLDDVYAVLLNELGVLQGAPDEAPDGIASSFLQLCYPWVRTAGSVRLPEELESPEGPLAGILGRNSLTRGAFASACAVIPRGIRGVSPAIPVNHLLGLRRDRPAFQAEHCFLDRVSIFGRRPAGIRLLSDVTTSLNESYRPASVNRLMSLLVRAARIAGTEAVFENSGPETWTLLVSQIGGLLEQLWELGALRGRSPEEAFEVRCDRSTMTENDLENGRLIAHVTFQAAAPVERLRVILTFESGGRVAVRGAA